MRFCPICETECEDYLCPVCGFDDSLNHELHPTLGWRNDVSTALAHRKMQWRSRTAAESGIGICAVCGKYILDDTCADCGFDPSTNYEGLPTLSPLANEITSTTELTRQWQITQAQVRGDWPCPICGSYNHDTSCSVCGFDRSADPEQHPTFSPIPTPIYSVNRRHKLHELEKIRTLTCPVCSGGSFYMSFSESMGALTCLNCNSPVSEDVIAAQKSHYQKEHYRVLRGNITAVAAGGDQTAILYQNGTVRCVSSLSHYRRQVSKWQNVVAIAAGGHHVVGLQADGTVVACGDNGCNQCDVSSWRDVIAIAAGDYHTLGLCTDGKVLAVGSEWYQNPCKTQDWTHIRAITGGQRHTVGVTQYGGLCIAGSNSTVRAKGQYLTNVASAALGNQHLVCLLSDGSVVAFGDNQSGQCNVNTWTDIAQVTAGGDTTVGIRNDGTVVSTGRIKVPQWRDIVAVSVGMDHVVGLTHDGRVLSVGNPGDNKCDLDELNK